MEDQENVVMYSELQMIMGRLPDPNTYHREKVVIPIATTDFTARLVKVESDKGKDDVIISYREIIFDKHKVKKGLSVNYVWKLNNKFELLIY